MPRSLQLYKFFKGMGSVHTGLIYFSSRRIPIPLSAYHGTATYVSKIPRLMLIIIL